MRLEIEHFAKIKKASVKLDGITVIAGENNTGKSTVGKILSCFFNSLYHIEDKVMEQKEDLVVRRLNIGLEHMHVRREQPGTLFPLPRRMQRKKIQEAALEIMQLPAEERKQYIQNFYEDAEIESEREDFFAVVEETAEKISEVLEISDKRIEDNLVQKYFSRCFANQMIDLYEPEKEAVATLWMKEQPITVRFSSGGDMQAAYGIRVLHEAICIGSPMIMNYMDDWKFMDGLSVQEEHLIQKLRNTEAESELEELLVNTKLENIFSLLGQVTKGKIVENEEGDFVLQDEGNISFDMQNLSMGVKAFSMIRMLLEKGILKERDVLILDEPEIHLHPEWQLIYAEIMVLLEKYFHLTILITTHSPYFLEAIEMYTRKHEVADSTNYYVTEQDGKEAVLRDVTGQLERVYRLLSEPFAKLESLQYLE